MITTAYYVTGCVECSTLFPDEHTTCPACGAHSPSGGGMRVTESYYQSVFRALAGRPSAPITAHIRRMSPASARGPAK